VTGASTCQYFWASILLTSPGTVHSQEELMKCFNSEMDALGSIPQEPMVEGNGTSMNFSMFGPFWPYLSEIPFFESNFL